MKCRFWSGAVWVESVVAAGLVMLLLASNSVGDTYMVWSNGGNTSPYDTWAKAATSVQTALDAATDGDTVLVTNGTYTVVSGSQVALITNGLTLVSANGAAFTTIDAESVTGRRGVGIQHSDAVVDGFTITRGKISSTTQYGAGVNMTAGLIRDCVISNNACSGRRGYGGGMYMSGGTARDCLIVGNTLSVSDIGAYGSGAYINGAALENCIIRDNTASASVSVSAGAVYMIGASTLQNCLVVHNAAGGSVRVGPGTTLSAGVYCNNSGARIENCTIADNTAQIGPGAGLYLNNGIASNTIVYFNPIDECQGYQIDDRNLHLGASASFENSCSYPLAAGTDNVSGNPLFADRGGYDYTLLPCSPCLDTAEPLGTVTNDVAGTARSLDGDGDGSADPDMGAYETVAAAAGSFRCSITRAEAEGFAPRQVVFTGAAAGPQTNGIYYRWDWTDDGSWDVEGYDKRVVTNTYSSAGWYDVELMVSNDQNDVVSRVLDDAVKVAPTTVCVATNGAHTFPFDSWGAAATNLQDAFSVAYADPTTPSHVLVTDGVYRLSERLVLDKGITVESVNGATSTVWDAQNVSGRRVFEMLSGASDATVRGFTLTGGFTPTLWYGGGIRMVDGTVSECTIVSNRVAGRNTRAGGVYMYGGQILDSIITGNSLGGSDGGARGAGIEQQGGLVARCWIAGNKATATIRDANGGGVYLGSGTLRNCVIVSNYVGGNLTESYIRGAGVYTYGSGANVEFCTITRNYVDVGSSAGVYMNNGAVTASILYDNITTVGGDQKNFELGGGSMTYSCSTPLPAGTGNTNSDPQFANADAADFSILAGSDVIDAATSVAGVTNDYMFALRPMDGDNDSLAVEDMGAYEYDPASAGSLDCNFTADPNTGVGSIDAVFTTTLSGTQTNGVTYFWDFTDDGSFDSVGLGKAVVTNTYGIGTYSVNLQVSNDVGTVTNRLKVDYISVASDVAYVSTNGSHTSPYDTWPKAATNIAVAVQEVVAGGRVIVSNGIYRVGSEINISRPVTVESVNGAGATIIERAADAGNIRIVYVGDAAATLQGFTIRGGRITSNVSFGGGLNLGDGTVSDCVITSNAVVQRQGHAGGVYMTGGTLRNCTIVGNTAQASDGGGYGGGIQAVGGLIESCFIASNRTTVTTSSAQGGGAHLSGSAVLRNCVVAANYAGGGASPDKVQGGGVYCGAAGNRVEHCTIADNYVDIGACAGIYVANGAVTNTIAWRNYLSGGDPDSLANHRNYELATGKTMAYCDSYPVPDGTNNIAADPQFADRANADYHLTIGSGAIDTGMDLVAVTNDYNGVTRPKDGDGDSTANADMGAFELDPAGFTTLACNFSANPYQGVTSLDAVFTAFATGPGAGTVHYFWDFENDGTFDADGTDKTIVTNQYGVGTYSVNLVVSNSLGDVTNRLKTDYIQVVADVAYVSPGGGHVSPYDTPAKAATNIQAAVNAVAADGHVYVDDGVYIVTEQITIARPITVSSLHGAGSAIAQLAAGVTARVLYMGDAGAVVEGFTIRGGSLGGGSGTTSPGGAGADVEAGTLRACIIVSNSVAGRFACGGGVYLASGGVLENCLAIGNYVGGSDTASGGGVYMAGGRVLNCTLSGNKVSGGASSGKGGGIYLAAGGVTNTILHGNTASLADGGNDAYGNAYAYCSSPDLPVGISGNTTANPLFATPGLGYGLTHVAGDYRLQGVSPCINTGYEQAWMSGARDLDGNKRVAPGGSVDMGAYEWQPAAGTVFMIR